MLNPLFNRSEWRGLGQWAVNWILNNVRKDALTAAIREGNCKTGRKREGILNICDSYKWLSMPMHTKRLEIQVKTDVHMKYEANKKERIWKIKLLGIDRKERTYLPTSDKCTGGQHLVPHNHQFIAMQSANSRLPLQLCLQNKSEICEKLVVENLCAQFLQKEGSKNNLG